MESVKEAVEKLRNLIDYTEQWCYDSEYLDQLNEILNILEGVIE